MKHFHARSAALVACLLVAACATAPKSPLPKSGAPASGAPPHPATEYTVTVESDPAGETVVVDNVPVGKTPQTLTVPVNTHGFCRQTLSIKVRFVAASPGQQSQTIEEVLTPLDKVPAALHFTLSGATRTAR